MAHRHKTHRRRRRRVSGVGGSGVSTIFGGIIGYSGGNMLSNMLSPTVTTTTPAPTGIASLTSMSGLISIAMVAAPIFLEKKLKGPLMQGIGVGVAIAGAKKLGASLGLSFLAGMPVVSGYRRHVRGLPVVSGSADQPYLQGGAVRQQVVSGVTQREKIYAGIYDGGDYNDS